MTKTELQLDSCRKKARMVLHWKVISWGQAIQLLILQLGLVCPWTSCFDSESPLWTDKEFANSLLSGGSAELFKEVNQVFLCISSILTFPTVMFFFPSVPVSFFLGFQYTNAEKSTKPSGWNGHERYSHMQLCLFWELILILYKFQIFTVHFTG